MLNAASTRSGYFQSTCCRNLPRLLDSFTQADIHHTVLSCIENHDDSQTGAPTETVGILLDPASYAKFQQVFLGQRCVQLTEYGEHMFWDSRTGLTIHITLNADIASRSEAQRTKPLGLHQSRYQHSYLTD
jgi:hypothetical protein